MSGNCASGIAKIAISPASVMTIEMTKASRGRSMKTSEIIAARPYCAPGGACSPSVALAAAPGSAA